MADNDSTAAPRFLLGVDGGGSRTVAAIARLESEGSAPREIARASSGAGNLVTCSNAREHVLEAISRARVAAARQLGGDFTVGSACLCLAGIARDAILRDWQYWVSSQSFADQIRIADDVEPVLRYGNPDEPALAVVSGTGSIVVGRDKDGNRIRCGGWGSRISDEGSGYHIATEALRCAGLHEDRRSSFPSLHAAALDHFDEVKFTDLIPQLESRGRREIAMFARRVVELAEQQSEEAGEVLQGAARQLAELVTDVARQIDPGCGGFHVVMAGGVLCNSQTLRELLTKELSKVPGLQHSFQLVDDPVSGALLLAADENAGQKR
ncbi:MAG: BadF/BadG/BcrA/BcrD ATPase family protein [Planctomycetota bacterium]